MKNIQLESLTLKQFDMKNKSHLIILKSLVTDESVMSRFTGFLPRLNEKSTNALNKGYLIADQDKLVGFIDIGAYDKSDKCVYLRAAIDKNERGKRYGKRSLSEVSNYLFQNYKEIESIRLKIAKDNTASRNTAASSGYKWLIDDFYYLNNPYLEKNKAK